MSPYTFVYPEIGGFQTKSADIHIKTLKLADVTLHFFVPRHLLLSMFYPKDRGISDEIHGCQGTFFCTLRSASFATKAFDASMVEIFQMNCEFLLHSEANGCCTYWAMYTCVPNLQWAMRAPKVPAVAAMAEMQQHLLPTSHRGSVYSAGTTWTEGCHQCSLQ